MKRTGNLAAAFAAALLALAGCAKQVPASTADEVGGNRVNLTVYADFEPVQEDGSRISSTGPGTIAWDGDEAVGVIFAKKASSTTNFRYVVPLGTMPGHPGVFSGSINLGSYSLSDIVGIVYPYSADNCWGKYHGTAGKRIVMQIGTTDCIQMEDGSIPWRDVPFFAEVSSSDFVKQGDGYVIGGKTFRCGGSLLEINVYGKHSSGLNNETLRYVKLNATTGVCCIGTAEWNIGSDSFAFNGNTDKAYLTADFPNPPTIKVDKEAGAKAYIVALPRGDNGSTVKFTKVTVITRRAYYEKTISRSISLESGTVHPINLDISTFTRTAVPYSKLSYDDVKLERGNSSGKTRSFVYQYYDPLAHRPIDVYYYIPTTGDVTEMPVLFAMHGASRTGESQVSYWKSYAESKGFIVIAPLFTKELYPNIDYQYGGVSYSNKAYMPRKAEEMTYNIIEALFDMFKDKLGNKSVTYDLWGHSAGSQFTHRMLLNMPDCRVGRAVTSNAGSYTFAVQAGIKDEGGTVYGFPYSVSDMGMSDAQLAKFFARDLTVHLGTADTATTQAEDPDLPVTDGAMAQGTCRYERGRNFFAACKAEAQRLGVPFNWKQVDVPGVAHEARKMVQTSGTGAAALLFP